MLLGFGAWALTTGAFVALMAIFGRDFVLQDAGDTFDKASDVITWVNEKLHAMSVGEAIPDPPVLYADIVSIKIGFGTTLVYDMLMVAIVGGVAKFTGIRDLLHTFGMERYHFDDLWRPVTAVVVAYVAVALYAVLMHAIGIGILEPGSTVPEAVTRDTMALAMAGVLACLAAPIAEELFFRGLVFGGLSRWGFWPAAALSGALFTLAHLDIGSLVPFFLIGLTLAWLFWSRGCLWDNVAFHFFFNTTSFLLLLTRL